MLAIKCGFPDLVSMAISMGADIDCVGMVRGTYAVEFFMCEVLKLFMCTLRYRYAFDDPLLGWASLTESVPGPHFRFREWVSCPSFSCSKRAS